jgi:hypothetical protein
MTSNQIARLRLWGENYPPGWFTDPADNVPRNVVKLLNDRETAIDRIHAVAWKVVIAASDDRGNLLPPSMLGEYWRRQLVRDLADVLTLLGGNHGDCGDCQEAQGAGQAQEGAPAQGQ